MLMGFLLTVLGAIALFTVVDYLCKFYKRLNPDRDN